MVDWEDRNSTMLSFIDPGKSVQNAFVESINGRLKDECLNETYFLSLMDARMKIENWRLDYNSERLHSSLNDLSPRAFTEEWAQRRKMLTSEVA